MRMSLISFVVIINILDERSEKKRKTVIWDLKYVKRNV